MYFKILKDRRFLIANAQAPQKPIIYCNDFFCDLVQFRRDEMMQRPCICEFLHGSLTSTASKNKMNQALSRTDETQVMALFYRKDGKFISNQN